MKKQVSDFISKNGAIASYSGATKTMYISSPSWMHTCYNLASDVEEEVINRFGYGLPFKIQAN